MTRTNQDLETAPHKGPEKPPMSQRSSEVLIVVHCGNRFSAAPGIISVRSLPKSEGASANQPQFVFGRDALLALSLRDRDLSREHFAIWKGPSGLYYLEDRGSRNGTHVDGFALPFPGTVKGAGPGAMRRRAELRDGAIIRAGNTLMVFRKDFVGSTTPDPNVRIGEGQELVSPYGLRSTLEGIRALRGLVLPAKGTEGEGPARNLLLEAETGTGKEMMARYLAQQLRPGKPYLAINATALPQHLVEANLFGHTRSAFTGATQASEGLIAAANGGTLFLDEIHELERGAQVKLLRFLETRDYLPVGASKPLQADVLVLVASSQALRSKVDRGEWHRDMFARLNQLCLRLPPLRARAEDIAALSRALLVRQGHDVSDLPVEVEAMERLLLDPWPENIRGLLGALLAMLLEALRQGKPGLWHWATQVPPAPLDPGLERSLSLGLIAEALRASEQEATAAKTLGISRSKLQRYLTGSTAED